MPADTKKGVTTLTTVYHDAVSCLDIKRSIVDNQPTSGVSSVTSVLLSWIAINGLCNCYSIKHTFPVTRFVYARFLVWTSNITVYSYGKNVSSYGKMCFLMEKCFFLRKNVFSHGKMFLHTEKCLFLRKNVFSHGKMFLHTEKCLSFIQIYHFCTNWQNIARKNVAFEGFPWLMNDTVSNQQNFLRILPLIVGKFC